MIENYTDIDTYGTQDLKAREEEQIIEAIALAAPLLQKALPIDCMIGIADTQKFVKYFPFQKNNLNLELVGNPVPEQDAIYLAMKKDMVMDIIIPKEVFGFSFRSMAVPLKNKSGKIVGGLGFGYDLENCLKVSNMSNNLFDSAEQITSVIEELTASAEELSNLQLNVQTNMKSINDKIEDINKLLQFINSIAATSKMLGLNASIEAARAGEQGKGFSVVAFEIRKMAENSASSVNNIKGTIEAIENEIKHINHQIETLVSIGQHQTAATEEISSSSINLSDIAEKLKLASQKVIG